jgi:hypothetical protein
MLNATLTLAEFEETWVWRTLGSCSAARVVDPVTDAWIDGNPVNPILVEDLGKTIDEWLAGVPTAGSRDGLRKRFKTHLRPVAADDNPAGLSDKWLQCAKTSATVPQKDFDSARLALLRGLVCDDGYKGAAIAAGIAATMTLRYSPALRTELARALLGEDGTPCAAASHYDVKTKQSLRAAADALPAQSPAAAQ